MLAALRFRADRPWERSGAEAAPEPLRGRFEQPASELAALGFEAFGWMQRGAETQQLLRRADGRAYALLGLASEGAPRVEFLSLAENGRQLATGSFRRKPEWRGLAKREWVDARALALVEQWQRHEAELSARTDFAPRDVSQDELIAECEDTARREREHMLARGAWASDPDGQLRVRPLAALAQLAGELRVEHAKRRALRARSREAEPRETSAPRALGLRKPLAAIALGGALLAGVGTLALVARREAPGPGAHRVDEPADVLDGPALEADVELARAERARAANDSDAARQHLARALDLREAAFGAESLEVAAVLEAFPPDPSEARAAALVRQLRLIAIYERARSPDRGALARAYEQAAGVRAELGDAAAAKKLRARAQAARGSAAN